VNLRVRLRLSDWDALRASGHRAVAGNPWIEDEAERAALLAEVDADPRGALSVLMDPDYLFAAIAGVETVDSVVEVGPAPGTGEEPGAEERPDFEALLPSEETHDGEAGGWLLTPRTAAVLHGQLEMLADRARDEAEDLGSAPVRSESQGGLVFGALPPLTWQQGAQWRARFVRSFEDLADDLARGRWPQPRCPAEEMALHLALRHAASVLEDRPEAAEGQVAGLPVSAYDYDWGSCRDLFFQDEDILLLYDARFEGVEDPETEINQELGIGDYRPAAWFATFGNMEPRET
jgi:hypothetical protein